MKLSKLNYGLILVLACFFALSGSMNASAKVNIPKPVEHTLENGLKILLLHSDKLPTFSASILIPSASALNDPSEKSGLASLTANLLDKGTRSMNREEIQGQLDFLGAEISADAGYGYSTVSLSGLTKDWEQLFNLFSETILHPIFPESEFIKVKKLKADVLKTIPDNPSAILTRAYYAELFKNSPLKNPSDGRLKDIEQLSVKDVKEFHSKYYGPKDAVLIISGKFPDSDLLQEVKKNFSSWTKDTPSIDRKISEFFSAPVKPRTVFVHKPELSQVWMSMGRYAVPRKDPRFYAIRVANQIMGGSFTSRLNQHIRDDLGLTYSISSSFSFGAHMGYFSLRTFVENAKLETMLKETARVLDDVKEKRIISELELDSARKYLTGVFPISIQSVDSLAGVYLKGAYLGMDYDFVEKYIPSIKDVTLLQVQDVAKLFFQSKSLLRVLVGDKNKIKNKKGWEIKEISDYL